jgi:hypothetical protein
MDKIQKPINSEFIFIARWFKIYFNIENSLYTREKNRIYKNVQSNKVNYNSA